MTDSATLERPSAFVAVDLASACTTAAEATIKTELEVDRASAIKRGRTDLPFTAEQEASIGSDIEPVMSNWFQGLGAEQMEACDQPESEQLVHKPCLTQLCRQICKLLICKPLHVCGEIIHCIRPLHVLIWCIAHDTSVHARTLLIGKCIYLSPMWSWWGVYLIGVCPATAVGAGRIASQLCMLNPLNSGSKSVQHCGEYCEFNP